MNWCNLFIFRTNLCLKEILVFTYKEADMSVFLDEEQSNLYSRFAQTRDRIPHQEAAFLSSRTRSASPAASHTVTGPTGMRVKGRTRDPDDPALQPLSSSLRGQR